MAPEADRRTLIRRVYFDLIGLPPTPEEVAAFVNDREPLAYEHVVDRLLASPRYGERWARHWMDIAHFAETHGHDQDRIREYAWPYRDYLIASFNADKRYGRFVEEQIAGDVLFPDDPQATVALGFLGRGPWDESSLRDIQENTLDRQIARYIDRDDIVSNVMNNFAAQRSNAPAATITSSIRSRSRIITHCKPISRASTKQRGPTTPTRLSAGGGANCCPQGIP